MQLPLTWWPCCSSPTNSEHLTSDFFCSAKKVLHLNLKLIAIYKITVSIQFIDEGTHNDSMQCVWKIELGRWTGCPSIHTFLLLALGSIHHCTCDWCGTGTPASATFQLLDPSSKHHDLLLHVCIKRLFCCCIVTFSTTIISPCLKPGPSVCMRYTRKGREVPGFIPRNVWFHT